MAVTKHAAEAPDEKDLFGPEEVRTASPPWLRGTSHGTVQRASAAT